MLWPQGDAAQIWRLAAQANQQEIGRQPRGSEAALAEETAHSEHGVGPFPRGEKKPRQLGLDTANCRWPTAPCGVGSRPVRLEQCTEKGCAGSSRDRRLVKRRRPRQRAGPTTASGQHCGSWGNPAFLEGVWRHRGPYGWSWDCGQIPHCSWVLSSGSQISQPRALAWAPSYLSVTGPLLETIKRGGGWGAGDAGTWKFGAGGAESTAPGQLILSGLSSHISSAQSPPCLQTSLSRSVPHLLCLGS